MKQSYLTLICIAAIVSTLVCSCSWSHKSDKGTDDETPSYEEILEGLRNSSSYQAYCDSIATAYLGAGAKCIDPVQGICEVDGNRWYINWDFGQSLQIPQDATGTERELDFVTHGNTLFLRDSAITILTYGSYSTAFVDDDEMMESIEEETADSLFRKTYKVESVQYGTYLYDKDNSTLTATIQGHDDDAGMNVYEKALRHSPYNIYYAVTMFYPDSLSGYATTLIPNLEQYPLGPLGTVPVID